MTDYSEELRKARGRVGFVVSSATKWLLRRIQSTWGGMDAIDREKLRWEVAAFANYTSGKGDNPQFEVMPIHDWASLLGAGDPSLPLDAIVKSLLENAKQQVEALVDQGQTTFNSFSLHHFLLSRAPGGAMRASVFTGSAAFNFHFSLLMLLARHGERIKRCPCCRQIFYVSRLGKKVCSGRCRSAHNIRKQRKTPTNCIWAFISSSS